MQVIDDDAGHTLAAVSTLTPNVRESLKGKLGANKDAAELVGKTLAEVCLSKNIGKVFFDRGGFKYHGRVQVSRRIRIRATDSVSSPFGIRRWRRDINCFRTVWGFFFVISGVN